MRLAKILATLAAVVAAFAGIAIYAGWYDVSATQEHMRSTYWLLEATMRRSVKVRSAHPPPQSLDDPAKVRRGFAIYRRHCLACHGAPGVAPEPFALGMEPAPANLAHTAREWSPGELFQVVKHGLRMTGMPAWEFRLNDEEVWATVAFLRHMARISPQEYRSLAAAELPPPPGEVTGNPDADRGRRAIRQYICHTCHEIPGIVGAHVPVGPPLGGIGSRAVIAGVLPNNPENLARWLRAPQKVNPHSAMPDLGVSERDARDIAAYLGTLK